MNKVSLEGRLTKDPEVADRSGTKVCDMRLAVNGPGKTPPVFIDVVAFNDLAGMCGESFAKGSRIEVSGALRYFEWEQRRTPKAKIEKRSKHSVLAGEVKAAA